MTVERTVSSADMAQFLTDTRKLLETHGFDNMMGYASPTHPVPLTLIEAMKLALNLAPNTRMVAIPFRERWMINAAFDQLETHLDHAHLTRWLVLPEVGTADVAKLINLALEEYGVRT